MGRFYEVRKADMAKTANAKAKIYSKYGREIYVCAKTGGFDPAGNLTLRGLIDRAKKIKFLPMSLKKRLKKPKPAASAKTLFPHATRASGQRAPWYWSIA